MTPQRILMLNAVTTTGCAAGMLVFRSALYPLFGLPSALLLDVLAIGLLGYAGALAVAARPQRVERTVLVTFAAADAAWVVASAAVLVLFWSSFAPLARVLIIVTALVVEAFATLQFRAAGRTAGRPQVA